MNRFFFVTSYDNLSGSMLGTLLNTHPDMDCHVSFPDPFLMSQSALKLQQPTVDEYVKSYQNSPKLYKGNIQMYSAFELQYKMLMQRTQARMIRANITMAPALRVKLLMKSWLEHFGTASKAVDYIDALLRNHQFANLPLFTLLNFRYFHALTLETAGRYASDIHQPNNRLFLLALATTLCHDTADLPIPCKAFKFQDLINDSASFNTFLAFLSDGQLIISAKAQTAMDNLRAVQQQLISDLDSLPSSDWHSKLLDYLLHTKLQTIYSPHREEPLIHFYQQQNYHLDSVHTHKQHTYSKLISIHLNSNRPAQLLAYFDNIEETADHPEDVEIIVNVDDHDVYMQQMLAEEVLQRRFTLKFTTSPKPDSFCDLWKPINKLLALTDANAYFLLNISDEMLFATQGWDTILKKYVGYFPDHIFRLRASRNKLRNYFDRWECSFAQDSIPITTKRWVDIGGDWNPCFGPDSYQQLIAFYLSREGAFSNNQYLRELPLLDIKFHGDVPAIGIEPHKQWKHSRDHVFAMQICQSYPMQLEARRRAVMLRASIIAAARNITPYHLITDPKIKRVYLVQTETNATIQSFSYHLSWWKVFFTNNWRKLRYFAYFGEGREYPRGKLLGFMQYLKSKYYWVQRLYWSRQHAKNLAHQLKVFISKHSYKSQLSYFFSGKWLRTTVRYLRGKIHSDHLQEQYQSLKVTCHELHRENEKLYQLLLQINAELPQQKSSHATTNVEITAHE